jgi:hypothetical protein
MSTLLISDRSDFTKINKVPKINRLPGKLNDAPDLIAAGGAEFRGAVTLNWRPRA